MRFRDPNRRNPPWLHCCPRPHVVPGARPLPTCTDATGGITFALREDDGGAFMGEETPGEETPGEGIFRNLPAGDDTIIEEMPERTLHAFGWNCTANGVLLTTSTAPLNLSGILSLTIGAEDTHCDWFDVPEPTGSMSLTTLVCPAGYPASGASLDDLYADCALVRVIFCLDLAPPLGLDPYQRLCDGRRP